MNLPAWLISEVKNGNVVLMLGAGASMEAVDDNGKHPPSGDGLGKMLSNQFLGGKFDKEPLQNIAELAISESGSLVIVQRYIKDVFVPFNPAESHKLIPTFRWAGLATTNYDLVIERAYSEVASAVQSPVPFIKNGDKVEDRLRGPESVAFLKLHGCITHVDNVDVPLILTPDQYVQFRKGRSRLFERFKDWCCERTIVFIGNQLKDSNLRSLLLELATDLPERQRFYAVLRSTTEEESRLWENKKITLLNGTLTDFMNTLATAVPSAFRGMKPASPVDSHPVAKRFKKPDIPLTAGCKLFLKQDVDYVNVVDAPLVDSKQFYRGFDLGWSAIEANLDVPRRLTDTILLDHVIDDERDGNKVSIVLVKGAAGSGKSVLLRRIAWEAARHYDKLCLYLKPRAYLDAAALSEIADRSDERLFLFVDDAVQRAHELHTLVLHAARVGIRLTLFVSARQNEWNGISSPFIHDVTNEYDVRYLTDKEVSTLLDRLASHGALGILDGTPRAEQESKFREQAGRQLLVALHEATLGEPFAKIVVDEYKNIRPEKAQRIYLDVCALNRLHVPVRAGIISRLHGISFREFKEQFLAPLELVVETRQDPQTEDIVYVARHSHIAAILFEELLRYPEDRFAEYLRCLQHLDIDYSADFRAFKLLVRGRELDNLFRDRSMVETLYKVAQDIAGPDHPYLQHQMAVYELARGDGNLDKAADWLTAIVQKNSKNGAAQHSIAELRLRQAKEARTDLLREKRLEEATEACIAASRLLTGSHPYHTLAKIAILRLETALKDQDTPDWKLEKLLKSAEEEIARGLQIYVGDEFLLSAEAQLAELLSNVAEAIKSLEKAFQGNARSSFVARSLARHYNAKGKPEAAAEVLRKSLEQKPHDRELHYLYAKTLLDGELGTDSVLEYHFDRAYSPGDRNYDAQLCHARQIFISKGGRSAKPLFEELSKAKTTFEARTELRYPLKSRFSGRVERIQATHCFIEKDGQGDWIFCRLERLSTECAEQLRRGLRVNFGVAFSMMGPAAFDVTIEGRTV